MLHKIIPFLFVIHFMCAGCVVAAFNEAEWRETYDHPKVRKATERWLSPGPELEKKEFELASKRGNLPKDPARAKKYIKELVEFYSHFYSTIYKGTKINTEIARRVIANPNFNEFHKGNASLLLYIDSNDTSYLKRYILSHSPRANLFLRVHDPAAVKIASEIVAGAYEERIKKSPGKYSKVVAGSLAGLAGMMYAQNGGDLAIAKMLFQDFPSLTGPLGMRALVAPSRVATTLYNRAPRAALEDFLYAQYQNGGDQVLANIKMNATPELAEIVDKVGERYINDARILLKKVKAVKPKAKPSSPAQPADKAK